MEEMLDDVYGISLCDDGAIKVPYNCGDSSYNLRVYANECCFDEEDIAIEIVHELNLGFLDRIKLGCSCLLGRKIKPLSISFDMWEADFFANSLICQLNRLNIFKEKWDKEAEEEKPNIEFPQEYKEDLNKKVADMLVSIANSKSESTTEKIKCKK